MFRRRSRRFVPGSGGIGLEIRAMMDASADGTDDPVYDAELASVGGDPNFNQTDQGNQMTALAMPGVQIAANMAPTKQDLIDAMEDQRTVVNDAASAFYKAASDYQTFLTNLKATRMAQAAGFSPNWQTNPQNDIEARMVDDMTWIKTQQQQVTADVADIQAKVKVYNQAIDDAEDRIEFTYMIMGYNDDGSEIDGYYYYNDETDIA